MSKSTERIKSAMIRSAVLKLKHSQESDWVDADVFALELAAERIAEARKAADLEQEKRQDSF